MWTLPIQPLGSAFGQGAATFTNASLGASVFGVEANSWGVAYAAAGQFTTDGNGNLTSGIGDDDENGSSGNGETIGGTYSISNEVGGTTYNGYGNLTLSPALQSTSVLGIYLTDPALNLNDRRTRPAAEVLWLPTWHGLTLERHRSPDSENGHRNCLLHLLLCLWSAGSQQHWGIRPSVGQGSAPTLF